MNSANRHAVVESAQVTGGRYWCSNCRLFRLAVTCEKDGELYEGCPDCSAPLVNVPRLVKTVESIARADALEER